MREDVRREFRELFARLEDLSGRARQGEVAVSAFLSPRERHYAEGYLRQLGVSFYAYGGYEDAERNRLYLLPEYIEPTEGASFAEDLGVYGFTTDITALEIRGSGYRALTHRDFMGSLLALGLQRTVIGDICADTESYRAVVFCDSTMAPFICGELERVGNDRVKLRELSPDQLMLPERRYATVTDTVASPRLDGVIAALCGLSRDRAAQTVTSGMVEMNFESEERPDRTVEEGALLSVRGVGRFRIESLSEQTKKGRLRLLAKRYL